MDKPYIKYGIILAIVNSVWMIIIYLLGLSHSITGLALLFLSIIFSIIFCVISVKEDRNHGGGYITFGKAFLTGFLTLFIAGLIGGVFYFIYAKYIDPDYLRYMSEELPVRMAEKFGAPPDQIEKMQEDIAGKEATLGAMEIMKQILGSAFWSAIIALIVGAIMKRNKPIELV